MSDRPFTHPEGFISTFTGKLLSPLSLRACDVDLLDIAFGLAHTYRWGGMSDPGLTVAEHSLLVLQILRVQHPERTDLRFHALWHDAGEAYLGDVPAPLKPLVQIGGRTVDSIEGEILGVISERFGLEGSLFQDPALVEADLCAREVERSQMRNMQWKGAGVPESLLGLRVSFWGPSESFHYFLGACMGLARE